MESSDTFSRGGTVFLVSFFFLSVTDFVFILLKLVLDIFWSVGCSRVDLGMDMVVVLDR